MRSAVLRLVIVFVQIFLLAAIPFGASQARAPILKPFELQDDALGESFALFKAHHPNVQCEGAAKTRASCYQWEDVSIFGLSARPDSDCTPAKHASPGCAQGLTAQFAEGPDETQSARRRYGAIAAGHRRFSQGWRASWRPLLTEDWRGADEQFRTPAEQRQMLLWRLQGCRREKKAKLRCC